ncbi:hypothetical protein AB0H47_34775 [Streptomyces globisporus]|uniref:hypothetical protein n=1 Tax=Streptomyces globisporus TaxID=1908 RepID=UPI00345FDBFC
MLSTERFASGRDVCGTGAGWGGGEERAHLKRLYEETGSPPLRRLAASPGAGGRLSKSTIGNILNGKHPTLEQLTALLAAFGASRKTTVGMLAAYRRILAKLEPPAVYPCDIVERDENEREALHAQEEARRRYRGVEPEPELGWTTSSCATKGGGAAAAGDAGRQPQ